jgi:magnesium-transporting ATPase (P-type)
MSKSLKDSVIISIRLFIFLGCCQWWNNAAKRVATLEFDRTRKSMGVIVKVDSGKNVLLVKVCIVLEFAFLVVLGRQFQVHSNDLLLAARLFKL